jgi:GntR family transcriptional repressor for pyruvate dehydrogenase complex
MNRAEPKPVSSARATRVAPKEDLTTKLIARFGDLLAEGVLARGAKLPPERELAKMFGVSRNSLRQALKVLQVMGLVQQRSGHGTSLNVDTPQILREPMRFLLLVDPVSHVELLEVRMIMEPELAAKAAERATLADLHEMDSSLERMEKAGDDKEKLIEADIDFHRAIYRAAGNRLCETMFSVIHKSLMSSIIRTSSTAKAGYVANLHRAVYRAVFERDPSKARVAMVHHLLEAQKVIAEAASAPVAGNHLRFTLISPS